MKIYTNKKKIIISLIILISLLLLIVFNYKAFIVEYKFNYIAFNLSLLFSIIACSVFAVTIDLNKKVNIFYTVFSLVLSILLSYIIVELLNENKLFAIYPKRLIFNFVVIILLHLLIYAISSKVNLTIILSNSIIFILGFINYTVICFRGTPFVPWDVLSLKTAVYVASSYSFSFSFYSLLAISLFIFIIAIGSKVKYKSQKSFLTLSFRIISIIAIIILILCFYKTDMINYFDFENNLWIPRDEYLNNGFLASFLKQSKNLFNKKPENYSYTSINNIFTDSIPTFNQKTTDEKPNIIVIMSESFSDLSVNRKF